MLTLGMRLQDIERTEVVIGIAGGKSKARLYIRVTIRSGRYSDY